MTTTPDYRHYFLTGVLFSLGLWMHLTAMGWLALELTDSAFMVSLINVAWFLPFFIFALPAGVIADRFDRKLVIMLFRGAGGIGLCLMAFLAAVGQLNYTVLWVLVFLAGVSVIAVSATGK